jgi:hypothetical protein
VKYHFDSKFKHCSFWKLYGKECEIEHILSISNFHTFKKSAASVFTIPNAKHNKVVKKANILDIISKKLNGYFKEIKESL